MGTAYATDIVAWAREQAALLRSGQLSALDIEHMAEEIEDVDKAEQRELARWVAVLLAHLLKWQHQPGRRGSSWTRTLKEQRKAIAAALRQTPSLKASLTDADWLAGVWADAVTKAIDGIGLDSFPEDCPWPMTQVLAEDFPENMMINK
ncbi:MAG: DUF29 domain-containing protein [Macromonas bipunctata]|nr:DUF29 domain-containing protein [Macromonas bipunctata]